MLAEKDRFRDQDNACLCTTPAVPSRIGCLVVRLALGWLGAPPRTKETLGVSWRMFAGELGIGFEITLRLASQ